MQVEFIKNDKYLEITDINTIDELNLLNGTCSAIPIKWVNKRPTKMPAITFIQDHNLKKYAPAGLWYRLYKLSQQGHNVVFKNVMYQDPLITKEWIEDFIIKTGAIYPLAPHQLNAVFTALKFKKSSCAIGTSGGKTFIAFALASILLAQHRYSPEHKYLIIVPSQLLCIQGLSDFDEFMSTMPEDKRYLKTHAIFSGAKNKHKLADANVVFATYQSLTNMTVLDDFFLQFKYVYVDEAHRSVNAVKNLLRYMQHIEYTNAFSGSFPEQHTEEMLNIETFVGPLLYEFKTSKLRDAGFTADFAIIPVEIIHKAEDTRAYFEMLVHEHTIRKEYKDLEEVIGKVGQQQIKLADAGITETTIEETVKICRKKDTEFINRKSYLELLARHKELRMAGAHSDFNRLMAEQEFLFTTHERHRVLANLAGKLDKNTLVLSRRRNDVKGLYDAGVKYNEHKVNHLVMGGLSNADKQGAIDAVKTDEDYTRNVVYGNVDMIGTGTSIKSLFYAIFAGVGKSPYTAIQTVGRMIRKFHAKEKAYVFDTYDVFECDVPGVPSHWKKATYSEGHAKARFEIYRNEDYEILDSKKVTLRT